jgi:PAS domain S-box-containing protein
MFGTWQNKIIRQKMEEKYTAAFFQLIEQINNVHLLLESKSAQHRSRLHSAMYAQFAIILILFILIALTFRKYENERNSRLAQIEDARKRASRSEEDLRSHKGKLLEANRELKTTMAELTSLNEKMEVQSSAMVKVNRELERNEAMLKSIFRVAPTGIGMTRDRVIEMTNEAIHRMTGYAEEELQGKGERFLYPDGEEFEYANRERYQQIDKYGTGTAITRWLRKDGIVIDVLLSSTPLDKNNLKAGVIFTALDITVQMESEKKIKGSLKEKEILLREIHHRVKNNLQVISSLLNLQAKYISDDKYREYFNDSQRRVRSMAIVHDRLYQSKDLEKVNFSEFIKILIHELLNVFRKNSSVIHVNYNIDEIYFGVDEAIPCALIINELVTNSLKYAFPGERGGEINIDFLKTDNGVYTLRIKDNGIGLPGGFSFDDTKSFGLGMVNILSSQLRGQVKYNSSQGTEFIVTFSYEEGSERKGRF